MRSQTVSDRIGRQPLASGEGSHATVQLLSPDIAVSVLHTWQRTAYVCKTVYVMVQQMP